MQTLRQHPRAVSQLFRLLAATTVLAAAPSFAQQSDSGAASPGAGPDTTSAIVQLQLDPLSIAPSTHPPQGKKIDFDSNTVKSYRARLSAQRNDYKQWLQANVPQAKITGQFDISLNAVSVQLNGATLDQVAASPLVRAAQYENVYSPISAPDPDMGLIRATDAWASTGGPATAGAGVKVAIVDTGIDVTHPCFSDAGYATQQQLGDKRYTNNKVIVAKVFNNKTPSRNYTAQAIQAHGTHVAGTVACDYQTPATVDGVSIPYGISGVAPRALLGNYNIFPADVANARSEDILNALDAAYADGFDVANLSLGGGSHGIQDLLTVAIDDLDAANMVVAVAAGNSGPGLFTVESPGSGKSSLTAGAASVPHLVGTPVTAAGSSYPSVPGEFGAITADIGANMVALTNGSALDTACTTVSTNLSGRIALLSRGACAFSAKLRNVQAAGAIAAIVANNVGGDPLIMATDGAASQPTIPGVMVAQEDGQALLAASGTNATISATQQYFVTSHADIMASFSSQGPTDVDFRVKPDVVAPGVNVLSSVPANACSAPPCFAFFQGTSMATPHLAGTAAFLRGVHPDWSAADIRSAIVNTAVRGVLRNSSRPSVLEGNVNVIGAGREDVVNANAATVALSPVSVSFGAVPSGSGDARSFDVTVRNLSNAPATLSLSVTPGDASVGFSLSTASLTLAAGASAPVTVTMTPVKGAATGGHQGTLEVKSGGVSVAHAAVYTLIK